MTDNSYPSGIWGDSPENATIRVPSSRERSPSVHTRKRRAISEDSSLSAPLSEPASKRRARDLLLDSPLGWAEQNTLNIFDYDHDGLDNLEPDELLAVAVELRKADFDLREENRANQSWIKKHRAEMRQAKKRLAEVEAEKEEVEKRLVEEKKALKELREKKTVPDCPMCFGTQ